jgi:hypothetical protein
MRSFVRGPRTLVPSIFAACLLLGGLAAEAAACPATSNVIFLVDTSGSMANITWHPAFDPTLPTSCTSHAETLQLLHDEIQGHCGTVRTYRVDPALEARGIPTRFDPAYLNWIHGLPDGHPYLAEIESDASGTLPSCLGGGSYPAYRESRLTAAKRFVDDVFCQTTTAVGPRLGLARLRVASDPAGGYLAAPVEDESLAHAEALAFVLDDLEPQGWGPLGEALFHIYTYLMSRDLASLPLGVDDFTPFPVYDADTAGNPAGNPPPSPVERECQENIVVLLGDDAPTRDDFDPGGPEAAGFEDFQALIGNYNLDDIYPEAGDEQPEVSPTCQSSSCEVALYLDDIAMFMHDMDFRPDLPGLQRVKIHTVGFSIEPFGHSLLEKTADVGGGLFLSPGDADTLAAEIIAASTQPPPPPPIQVPALGGAARLATICALSAAGLLARRRSRRSADRRCLS